MAIPPGFNVATSVAPALSVQAAPGHRFPTGIAFIQLTDEPQDILFFQNWPDEIREGLTSAWAQLNFPPATAPLAFQYEGTIWDPIEVKLIFHSGVSGATQSVLGVTDRLQGIDDFSRNIASPVLDLLRIQIQVAWCKSIALPRTDFGNAQLRKLYEESKAVTGIVGAFKLVRKTISAGLETVAGQGSKLFPPMCRIAYGGFLVQFGYCASVKIRYLPPFTPVSAHPHRAEVDLTFHRAFPAGAMPNALAVRRRALLGIA